MIDTKKHCPCPDRPGHTVCGHPLTEQTSGEWRKYARVYETADNPGEVTCWWCRRNMEVRQ